MNYQFEIEELNKRINKLENILKEMEYELKHSSSLSTKQAILKSMKE